MEYVGEHWWIGRIGHFLVILSFVSALLAAVSYWWDVRKSKSGWATVGRWSFRIHSLSVLGIIASLFVMLIGQYFEYDYVWKHSNTAMPMEYIFSCFWEGQEGSFLLWLFWHAVLGNILIFTARIWESPVMAIFSIVQVFLSSMLLGIYILDYKMGSSPFVLIRELPENIGLPWTQMSNYLSFPQFQDGRGLNPLLQNYWMTIHPPTLFLGFSATLVPFAYAIAGIWTRQYREWIKPGLPWAYFAVGIFGLGILMGGAWAYEALSFGGFWAWDPVENASLVPWILLVGGAHLMLINRNKSRSIFSTYLLITLAFIFVLYSTFLTRSGVLGDTSVHSFTSDGMLGQLLAYMLFFVMMTVGVALKREAKWYGIISLLLFVVVLINVDLAIPVILIFLLLSLVMILRAYRRYFPRLNQEEELWSREFWVFIGSLVLLLSAAQITFETSKPVYNLIAAPFAGFLNQLYLWTDIEVFSILADGRMAPKSDVIAHYNKWQLPFAFMVTTLIAIGQYFSYKKTDMKKWLRNIALSFAVSVVLTVIFALALNFRSNEFTLIALMFSSIFAVAANADYMWRIARGKMKITGSSIAHIGFGLLMLGALISTGKSVKISENTSGVDISKLNEQFSNQNDILLFRGDTLSMNEYFILYTSKEREGHKQFYNIEYFEKLPRKYEKGEVVYSSGFFFRAKEDHQAGESFMKDQQQYWEMLNVAEEQETPPITMWNAYKPGEMLFVLRPHLQINEKFGNVPEPDTKHYFNKDVYTHIRWAELEERELDSEGYFEPKEHVVQLKDTIFTTVNMVMLDSVQTVHNRDKYNLKEGDIAARAVLRVVNQRNQVTYAEPLFILRDSSVVIAEPFLLEEHGLKFAFARIHPQTSEFTMVIAEHESNRREFIVMQAILFPMINILWIGCILMVVGTIVAVFQRVKLERKE